MEDRTQQVLDRVQQEELAAQRRAEERKRRRAGLSFRTWHVIGALCLPLFVVIAILSAASAPHIANLGGRFVAACIDGLGAAAAALAVLLPLCWIGAYLRGLMRWRAR